MTEILNKPQCLFLDSDITHFRHKLHFQTFIAPSQAVCVTWSVHYIIWHIWFAWQTMYITVFGI